MGKLGLSIPSSLSIEEAISVARETRRGAFDSLWTGENRFEKNGIGEPLLMLEAYANANPNVRVGTGIVDVYTRHPVLLASSALTLDNMTGGRFTLGLGVSHP